MSELVIKPPINTTYVSSDLANGTKGSSKEYSRLITSATHDIMWENATTFIQETASAVNIPTRNEDIFVKPPQSTLVLQPQLTPPTSTAAISVNDNESIANLLATLGAPITDKSVDSVRLRLEIIKQRQQAEQAETERKLGQFEKASNNLLLGVPLKEDSTDAKMAGDAIKVAQELFITANAAMGELDAALDGLPASANANQLTLLTKAKENLDELDFILLSIQQAVKKQQIDIIQEQTDLYKKQQEALQDKLMKRADEAKANDDKKKILNKWLTGIGIALAFIFTAYTGATFGLIAGLASGVFAAADIGSGGKISGALMTPFTKGTEAIANKISEAMKKAGYSESDANIAAMIVGSAVMISVALVGAKAASEVSSIVGERLLETGLGQAAKGVMSEVSSAYRSVIDSIPESLKSAATLESNSSVDKFLKSIAGDEWKAGFDKMIDNLFGGLSEENILRVQKMQVWTTFGAILLQSSLNIASSVAREEGKDIQADATKIQALLDIYISLNDQIGDTFKTQISQQDKIFSLVSDMLASHQGAGIQVTQNIPV